MSKNKLISLKRIEKDIKDLINNPLTGIGIIKYENDFMKYIVNIKLLNGIYEGYCLQLLLSFSEHYPVKPPKILIFPNQEFNSTYHHHIFEDKNGFKKFCFDLLDNDFMNINEINTGWNPSYTISSLLLQVQNFLCDPDMPKEKLPDKYLIIFLFYSMKNYKKTFVDEFGKRWIHTWENPYPPMFGTENEKIDIKEDKNEIIIDNNYAINGDNKKEKEINNDVNIKNNEGNFITNLFSYFGSYISYNPFSSCKRGKNYKEINLDTEEKNFADSSIINNKHELKEEDDKSKQEINEIITKEEEEKREKERLEKEKRKEEMKKEEEKRIEEEKRKEEEIMKELQRKKQLEEIKQNLTCFVLRVNIFDDKDICLGYPLKQIIGLGDKIECLPIPELLSYEGYLSHIAKQDGKLDDYFNVKFKAANNEYYNYWLPIYINKDHFQRNKILILNSFSVLKFGAKGQKEYDFKPEHIFEYLPNLLNKMICGMFNEKSYMSEAYIRSYFQYLLLFKKLIEEFNKEFHDYLNNIFDKMEKNKYEINKTIVPDLGNLYMLLFFSDEEIDKKIWNVLFEENMIRKIYWTFHHLTNEVKSESLFDSYGDSETNQKILDLMKKENIYYYEYLEEYKKEIKYVSNKEECLFSRKENIIDKKDEIPSKGLFNECIEKGIFNKLVNIIAKEIKTKPKNLNDLFNKKDKKQKIDEETKNKIKIRIIEEFPSIYKNEISVKGQNKIDKLLLDNIDIYKYCSNEIKKVCSNKKSYFETNQVDELMKKINKEYHSDIVKKLYDISKDNLLLITTLAQKKMNEKGFLAELEDNYGMYMNTEEFIKEINKKIKEVQCYKDLFDFMKADVIFKNENEYDAIIKSYQRAKEKRYIKTIVPKIDSDSNCILRSGNDFKVNNDKNKDKKINNKKDRNYKNNNYNRDNRNRINNYYNNRNRGGRGNAIHNIPQSNSNNRRRNNFNSHMVDLDKLLEE